MYTYRDIETGRISRTRGQFAGWTQPTGILHLRYAIFCNPRGDIFIPEYLLTAETKKLIGQPA